MGFFITYLKVQPFIATLAGLWFARGLCFLISDNAIRIYEPAVRAPGRHASSSSRASPTRRPRQGDYVSILVVVALVVLVGRRSSSPTTRGSAGRSTRSAATSCRRG